MFQTVKDVVQHAILMIFGLHRFYWDDRWDITKERF